MSEIFPVQLSCFGCFKHSLLFGWPVVLVFSYENHGKPGQQNKCGGLPFSTT